MPRPNSVKWMIPLALAASAAACGGGSDDPATGPGMDSGSVGSGSGLGSGVANVALRSLTHTDSGNWAYRLELQTAADATPNAAGDTARYEQYARSTSGSVNTWQFGPDPAGAGDLYFNGETWRQCEAGYRTTLSPFDASGERRFNYCDQYATGIESVIPEDISGRTIASVMTAIRGRTGGDGFVEYASYGPANLSSLGQVTFPANAYRQDVLSTVDVYRPRYRDIPDNRVRAWLPAIAAGGDARNNPSSACNLPGNAQIDDVSPVAVTLEQMIASAPGTPCRYTGNTTQSPIEPNEFWQPTTQEFGVLPGVDVRPPNTGSVYNAAPSMRVAFTGPNQVTFYRCLVRAPLANGSPASVRNCTPLGVGTYGIQSAGDGRVLMMDGMPAEFDGLGIDRVFIERNGAVYAGTMERAGVRDQVGFNDVATRAIMGALNIPVPLPR